MSELILLGVIALLCILIVVKEYFSNKERNKFINAISSKNANEQAILDSGDKIKPQTPTAPNFISQEALNPDEWLAKIKEENV